jgi:hypothetical protein
MARHQRVMELPAGFRGSPQERGSAAALPAERLVRRRPSERRRGSRFGRTLALGARARIPPARPSPEPSSVSFLRARAGHLRRIPGSHERCYLAVAYCCQRGLARRGRAAPPRRASPRGGPAVAIASSARQAVASDRLAVAAYVYRDCAAAKANSAGRFLARRERELQLMRPERLATVPPIRTGTRRTNPRWRA